MEEQLEQTLPVHLALLSVLEPPQRGRTLISVSLSRTWVEGGRSTWLGPPPTTGGARRPPMSATKATST